MLDPVSGTMRASFPCASLAQTASTEVAGPAMSRYTGRLSCRAAPNTKQSPTTFIRPTYCWGMRESVMAAILLLRGEPLVEAENSRVRIAVTHDFAETQAQALDPFADLLDQVVGVGVFAQDDLGGVDEPGRRQQPVVRG